MVLESLLSASKAWRQTPGLKGIGKFQGLTAEVLGGVDCLISFLEIPPLSEYRIICFDRV